METTLEEMYPNTRCDDGPYETYSWTICVELSSCHYIQKFYTNLICVIRLLILILWFSLEFWHFGYYY